MRLCEIRKVQVVLESIKKHLGMNYYKIILVSTISFPYQTKPPMLTPLPIGLYFWSLMPTMKAHDQTSRSLVFAYTIQLYLDMQSYITALALVPSAASGRVRVACSTEYDV